MCVDYLDAYERHWEDAEVLFREGRWGNAEHLYGLSVECGIKAILKRTRGSVPHKHLPDLAQSFKRFEFIYEGRRIVYELPNKVRTNFHDWDISQRYHHREVFSEASATDRQRGARAMRGFIKRLQKEGWLR